MPEHLRAAVALAAWGGLRRGEVLGLRRKDVDVVGAVVRVEQAQTELDDGRVEFRLPKTDAGVRSVHLPQHAVTIIREHLARHVERPKDALLFTGRTGAPMRPKTLETAYRKARSECELPSVHFHDLRHFSLTVAATQGVTTKELMRRAGHRSSVAALHYQHASEERDRAIAAAMDGLVPQADIVPISRKVTSTTVAEGSPEADSAQTS